MWRGGGRRGWPLLATHRFNLAPAAFGELGEAVAHGLLAGGLTAAELFRGLLLGIWLHSTRAERFGPGSGSGLLSFFDRGLLLQALDDPLDGTAADDEEDEDELDVIVIHVGMSLRGQVGDRGDRVGRGRAERDLEDHFEAVGGQDVADGAAGGGVAALVEQ